MAADCSCVSLGSAQEHSLVVTNRDAPVRKTVSDRCGNPPRFRMEIGVMRHNLGRRAFCVAVGLIGLGAASTDAWAQDAKIRLGLVAPMSGPNSRYGSFSLRGAQLAAEEINTAGGIGGPKLGSSWGDSQGTPVEGVSATRRLIDLDKVDFIIGDVSSSVTLAMQPVAEDAGVLLLNAASSNPKITYSAGVGGFKWTFRNYPTDENRALIVIPYAAEKRGRQFEELADRAVRLMILHLRRTPS